LGSLSGRLVCVPSPRATRGQSQKAIAPAEAPGRTERGGRRPIGKGYSAAFARRRQDPKSTPAPIVATLNEKIRGVMKTPEAVKRWQDRGLDVIASTPDEMAAHLAREIKKWGAVFREQGIRSE